jgi:hypothetical protein
MSAPPPSLRFFSAAKAVQYQRRLVRPRCSKHLATVRGNGRFTMTGLCRRRRAALVTRCAAGAADLSFRLSGL